MKKEDLRQEIIKCKEIIKTSTNVFEIKQNRRHLRRLEREYYRQ